jgi:hypothetical protein
MFKKMLTLVLAAASMAALPGCTDNEIAASALVIGAAVICDTGCGDGYHHHHRHGRYRRHRHYYSAGLDQTGGFVSQDSRVIAVSDNYDVTHYAATYLVRAVVLAQTKDTSGIKALGLDVSDFKDIMKGNSLEDAKLEALAKVLLVDKTEAERIVGEMSEDIQAEKAARGL